MATKPVEILIMEGLKAEDFNDDVLGRTIDKLYREAPRGYSCRLQPMLIGNIQGASFIMRVPETLSEWLYNSSLAMWNASDKIPSKLKLQAMLPKLKEKKRELKEVNSICLNTKLRSLVFKF